MSSPSSWNRIKAVMHRPCFCLVRLYVSGTFIFLPEVPFVSEMVNNMYSKWCKHIGVFGFCFILFAELLFIYGQRFCASTVELFCITWRNIKFIFMRYILKMYFIVFRVPSEILQFNLKYQYFRKVIETLFNYRNSAIKIGYSCIIIRANCVCVYVN